MKKFILVLSMIMISVIALITILSCDKDDKNPTGPSSVSSKVTCEAGCSSMSWGIKGETGQRYSETQCTRSYTSTGDYVETCTGTVTYTTSGKTYNFSAIYDWPNCKISVTVTNVGKCSNTVALSKPDLSKSNNDCHCDSVSLDDMNIKYKE